MLPIEIEINAEAEADIVKGLENGTTIGVSDGSYKSGFGTAAMILFNRESGKFIRGCLISHGGSSDQSPYRSELMGLAALITFVYKLSKRWNIVHPKLEIACDGKSALENIFDPFKNRIQMNIK